MSGETLDYYFKGKGSFFNNLLKGDTEYKNWNIKCNMIPESAELFRSLQQRQGEVDGILNELKEHEDGPYHNFKRPFFKDFGKGEVPMLPPEVVDKDGNPWDRNIGIGNGSDITVKVECYPFTNRRTRKRGRAIRLAAVRIDNLVP